MEKKTENKIVPYKKKRYFPFIPLVFGAILIYMIAQICITAGRESVSIFTLSTPQESTVLHEYRGVITRDERIMRTSDNGYINYYVCEGKRISANTAVYMIDESGEFSKQIEEKCKDGIYLSTEQQTELKKKLSNSSSEGITGDFQTVYKKKADISAAVMDAFLYTAIKELDEPEQPEEPEEEEVFKKSELDYIIETMNSVYTDQSGYIMFRTDTLDGLTADQVTAETFQETLVHSDVYISGEYRKKGSFAYKLIKDDLFDITFQITKEDAEKYRNKKNLNIELVSLGVTTNGSFSIFTAKDGTLMATISLNKYGSEYLTERFVDFKITESAVNGYKIPVTSVFTRDFIVIPRKYLTQNNKVVGVYKENYNLEEKEEFIAVSIYAETDVYYYISSSNLALGDYLIEKKKDSETGEMMKDGERYLLAVTAPLYGVYNVNKGYCIFRQVDIINTTTDGNYYMIKTGTRYGLASYDRIVQYADTVNDNQIIY